MFWNIRWILLWFIFPVALFSETERIKCPDHPDSLWVFKLQGKNEYLKISLKDTLVDSIRCIRYMETYTSSPLGGVDVILEKSSGVPCYFYIPALGEEVHVNKEDRKYEISKNYQGNTNRYSITYDSLTIPSYGRYLLPLFYPPETNMPVNLYMFSGKTCPYLFTKTGEETLIIREKEIPCVLWKIETQAGKLLGQEDWLWISKDPPYELLKIRTIWHLTRVFGLRFGKKSAVFERVF